jgi:Fe2+ transport system protein FeoA
MIPGVPVTIVRKAGRNPMLLSVMGRQVVLGRGMAEKVFVR